MPTVVKTVGEFTYYSDGSLEGPALYLEVRGNDFIKQLNRGDSAVLRMGLMQGSDPVTAFLVALQTDFAGWKGTRQLVNSLKR